MPQIATTSSAWWSKGRSIREATIVGGRVGVNEGEARTGSRSGSGGGELGCGDGGGGGFVGCGDGGLVGLAVVGAGTGRLEGSESTVDGAGAGRPVGRGTGLVSSAPTALTVGAFEGLGDGRGVGCGGVGPTVGR
mgnify:CR=1 FL=1